MSLLIFDLDGTLIDSQLDLANSVNAALAEMKHAPLPVEQIPAFVGDGAPLLIRRAMGPEATEEEFAAALEFFLAHYRSHALDFTRLYPGVEESLLRLHQSGVWLAILTNKPVRISRMILEGLGVAPLFFQIYGGNSFDQKKPNPIGIDTLRAEAAAKGHTPPAGLVWMVGDTYIDIQTARNAKVSACGVSWGFRPESFREFPPDLLISRMEELEAALAR